MVGRRWLSRPRRPLPGYRLRTGSAAGHQAARAPPATGVRARPRLVEALDEGRALGLILVCAPAGFGKTVLLADWAKRGSRPAAWLSLDTADNDPARFGGTWSPHWTGPAPGSGSG